ncbi:uncharacterized protein Z520_09069 [Fonsecaea multimorphosa CBS 102226]|uniref:Pre-mRNA splicing factor CLF1 n=1 Tax=Fonsecaea multimorphosa CBS 102226 TaxID=1442371 RepID=A0A0D2KEM6_9EURO|nr:uncharacterized protein Z520_09069 [Fonsecaea multimorphosa CBS 102226]KIX95153.1 hypothetical protein Z520_09069 [Fonsecaea multimorphosa CBS 102226]OAL20873.1 hypothetical protein AYO22_08501 [Fonsecaea multimorphosa]
MSVPKPSIAIKNHCSVIHDGVIYVYSPDAFQTLALTEGAQWKEEANGVSVTGAVCVKGGVDGDNSKSALYVVGGATNASTTDYTGLQRYSFEDKSWQTVVPMVNVTQNRLNHGAAYLNASSTLVVYGGSQNDDVGPSSETFTIELFPPYSVLAYSSSAPPTVSPFMLPWSQDHTLMVGGSSTNDKLFTFGSSDGWQDLGLTLPAPLPDHSIAQSALFGLADDSMVLQTFDLGQMPPTVTTNVLLNSGGAPAAFGETVGGSNTTQTPSPSATTPSKAKRQVSLDTFPAYNDTLAPTASRTGFDLAQGDNGLVALVGGNDDNPVLFFNQSENGWLPASQFFGKQQQPLATSSSRTPTSSPTSSSIPTFASAPTGSSTPAPAASSGNKSQGLTVLGAVLGAICGVLAILVILLLWLRSIRRRRRAESEKRNEYRDDKKRSGEYNYEERGLRPLAGLGQPMGRSPIASAVIPDADSTSVYGDLKPEPGMLIRRVSSDHNATGYRGSGIGFGQALFKREKEREKEKEKDNKIGLTISKPMMPILNDYQARPSIELGKATPPGAPVVAAAAAAAATDPDSERKHVSQRKTDEGWGKYFAGETLSGNRTTFMSRSSGARSGFWPGSGVLENSSRSPKFILRDSVGNPLEAHNVAAGSPNLEHGPSNPQSRGLQSVQGISGQISHAGSVRTANSTDDDEDDDYEDEQVFEGAFSSGIPASVHDIPWTPVGNTWSGPPQRPLRPPSSYIAAQQAQQAQAQAQRSPPTISSNETSDTSGTLGSSIPSFPMPNSVRSAQPGGSEGAVNGNDNSTTIHQQVTTRPPGREQPAPARGESHDYFSYAPAHKHKRSNSRQQPDNHLNVNTDMSWLNLGTPTR